MKEKTLEGIKNYVERGIPPGEFLYSVLTNNLKESIKTADEENLRDIVEIVEYCYQKIPSICWGSVERVRTWMDSFKIV